ncbi:MAG: 50S ribosomal protein L9 [Bacillota bacterium]
MQVILQKDVSNLGKEGDLKDVAPGYARNLLFPKNLAVEATPPRIKEWEKRREKEEMLNRQLEEQARSQADELNQLELVFHMPAGEEGKLFGSVTPADIAEKLSEKGFDVDKKDVDTDQHIKNVGNYTATIKLHPEIKAEVSVRVEKE